MLFRPGLWIVVTLLWIASPGSAEPWPPSLGYVHMVYDSAADALVLLGGQTNRSRLSTETWVYSCSSRLWSNPEPTVSPPSGDSPLAYDTRRQRVLAFIGADYFLHTARSETWTYDVLTNTWTKLETQGAPPVGLLGALMVYDQKCDRFVLFGGLKLSSGDLSPNVWVFDPQAATWTMVRSSPSPVGRDFHEMTYDAKAERVIVWGGAVPQPAWSFDTAAGLWTVLETPEDPVPLLYGALAYSTTLGASVLFGGCDWIQEKPTNTLAVFDASARIWTPVASTSTPPPQAWHALVFAERNGQFYAFGGGPDRTHFTSELWTLDPADFTWTLQGRGP